jgi:putative tricarboxylic transport membrane protein
MARRFGGPLAQALILALVLSGCQPPDTARGWECIAPANPGGGWDLTCRTTARALGELGLAPGMMRVTNMPGAGGGIAYAHTVSQRQGDGNVLVAASPATVLRLAQRQFAHLTEEEVRWVGAVATDYGILAVQPGARWRSLEELLEQWRREPGSIVVSGGSAVGGQDHMKVLLLADRAGIDPLSVRYVPFDGGGEAMTALLGGFVDVFSGDVTQGQTQLEAGNIRVLTVMSEERVGGPMAGVPTARELGYPVEWVTWRGFYAPTGIDAAAYARWVEVLDELAHSEEWASVRAQARLDAYFLAGEPFEAFVREQVAELRALSRRLGLIP